MGDPSRVFIACTYYRQFDEETPAEARRWLMEGRAVMSQKRFALHIVARIYMAVFHGCG